MRLVDRRGLCPQVSGVQQALARDLALNQRLRGSQAVACRIQRDRVIGAFQCLAKAQFDRLRTT